MYIANKNKTKGDFYMKKTYAKTISVILAMLMVFQVSIIGASAMTQSEENAICQIRDNMVNRNEKFNIAVNKDNLNVSELVNKAVSEEYSDSNEAGDYLLWNYLEYNSEIKTYDNINYNIAFDFKYKTTREQELSLTQKISNTVKEIGLTGGTDYEKIKKIHDYIVDIVKYDTSSTNCSTAYGALFEGKASCIGYASLFYRLCKEVGIDTRIITGNGHAWNIVKLDNTYFNIDCTWDDADDIKTYTYFLKCDNDFPGHSIVDSQYTTDEFNSKYNKSNKCFGGCFTYLEASIQTNIYNSDSNDLKINNNTKTSISKITSGKKKANIKLKKKSEVSGYQIQYSTSKKFTKKTTKTITTKKTAKTIKNLKSNKKYYFRVRTYKNHKFNDNRIKTYSSWSKVKSVKVRG